MMGGSFGVAAAASMLAAVFAAAVAFVLALGGFFYGLYWLFHHLRVV